MRRSASPVRGSRAASPGSASRTLALGARARWLVLSVGGPLLVGLASPAGAADDAELQKLRNAIYESRERVGGHERQEREQLEQLEQSDRLSAALTTAMQTARDEADQAREASIHLEERRVSTSQRLEVTRRALSKRAVALYKAGEVGPLRFVFGSSTIPELLTRVSALRTFVEFDAVLVERYRTGRDEFARLQAAAVTAGRVHTAAAERLEALTRELDAEREVRRRLLARARSDRTRERALLVELEKAARALEETIAVLGDRAAANEEWLVGRGFAKRRGKLTPPLPTRIRLPFGRVVDEQFRTETYRKGVEFEANGGESVHAVAPGVVRYAGWFRGYGKLVILDQGDQYFSVMSHLGEIFVAVGDSVKEGDMLGSVGDTGSLSGPSLYFELRHRSEPLDPGEWLRAPRPAAPLRAERAPSR